MSSIVADDLGGRSLFSKALFGYVHYSLAGALPGYLSHEEKFGIIIRNNEVILPFKEE